jgi:hypothetical protein
MMNIEPLAIACLTMVAISGYLAFDSYRNRRALNILAEYITQKGLYNDYMEWISR